MAGAGRAVVAPPALPSSAAHVFVSDLDRLPVEDADRHHLGRVLRLRTGDAVTASDGRGRWRLCRVAEAKGAPSIAPDGDVITSVRPSPAIEMGIPLLKGGRLDWAVQKCTEVGVDRIVVLDTARAVVRWSHDESRGRMDRLGRIAREAAMQARRAWLPELAGPISVADVMADTATAACAALAARGGPRPDLGRPFILVGPEGGFDPSELAGDLPRVGLGPMVLRSETAAVAGTILLSSLRGV